MAADPQAAAQLDSALEMAAQAVGDIVPPVMALFYTRFPDARDSFEHHGLGNREKLEREMVDNALYCLMTWPVRRAEVEILLYGSVPHHMDTLAVNAAWYRGLISAVVDVIADALPEGPTEERQTLEAIRHGICAAITEAQS